MRTSPNDSTLVRGRILTLEPRILGTNAVLIRDGRVAVVGMTAIDQAGPDAGVVELAGNQVAVPGFVDEHLHLLSMAAAQCSIDADRTTIDGVLAAIASQAEVLPTGTWVRGVGYDDALVAERRHPTRHELDRAGGGRPVVLHHRTGHVAVLSSAALAAVGEPDHPDGILSDRHDLLDRVPRLDPTQLAAALDAVLTDLAAAGMVAVTDATHTNDRDTLDFLDRPSPVEVTAMVGWDRLAGLRYGDRVGQVRVGHAKVMPGADDQALTCDGLSVPLRRAVAAAHDAGFPVAVHVMDIDTLAATIDALGASPPPAGLHDRIEHCALALPGQLDALATLPVEVVTQPSFLSHRAAKYRHQLSEIEHQWLWPLESLIHREIPVHFSSDAPVVPARPDEWIAAAMDTELRPDEKLFWLDALEAATGGQLEVGSSGRLVVMAEDLCSIERVLGAD
ncbi:MAG: amidohydrolase family protein [Actinomycetia bacterium]|nr:amidohydrolase family protein [Actinomycetes bacterium]